MTPKDTTSAAVFLHDQKTAYVSGIHFEQKDEAVNT